MAAKPQGLEPKTRALGQALDGHRRAVWGLCYRMTGVAADADDLVQETTANARAVADGGGEYLAAPRVLEGASNVARFFVGIARGRGEVRTTWLRLNGLPALTHPRVLGVLVDERERLLWPCRRAAPAPRAP